MVFATKKRSKVFFARLRLAVLKLPELFNFFAGCKTWVDFHTRHWPGHWAGARPRRGAGAALLGFELVYFTFFLYSETQAHTHASSYDLLELVVVRLALLTVLNFTVISLDSCRCGWSCGLECHL